MHQTAFSLLSYWLVVHDFICVHQQLSQQNWTCKFCIAFQATVTNPCRLRAVGTENSSAAVLDEIAVVLSKLRGVVSPGHVQLLTTLGKPDAL